MMTETAKTAGGSRLKSVDAGAALLDERLPGWRSVIDEHRLDLQVCSDCVLGQLFSDYDRGLEILDLTQPEAEAYGFYRSRTPWARLTEAWRAKVRA